MSQFDPGIDCREEASAQRLRTGIDDRRVSEVLVDAFEQGNKVLLFGNGGSAADAQHIAAEFVGRFAFDRPALPALALSVNTSCVTAIGNDYGFDLVFSRQIEALGRSWRCRDRDLDQW